jgi:ParB-like chromosome segregation protein Spo0J
MTDARISRAVPLDQLRQPETDVRERRSDDDVMSLAASMGDPAVGQLQDVLVHPVDPEERVDDGTAEELHDLFTDGCPLRIVDGETRRLAAKKLGWATVNATIVPEPPEETVVAQLDANTERIEMTEYETVRALYDYYQETDATMQDVAEKVGYSRSHLNNIFRLLEGPDWLRDPWRNPNHPLETGHARAVLAFLSEQTIKQYMDAGGLEDDVAHEKAVADAQLMIRQVEEYEPRVGDFRERATRKKRETLNELKDQRTREEKQADGQTQAAEQRANAHQPAEVPDEICLVCGDTADRKKAVDVCQEDYGVLSEAEANGEPLLQQSGQQSSPPQSPEGGTDALTEAAQALSKAAGVPLEDAKGVVEKVQQQVAQQRQGTD